MGTDEVEIQRRNTRVGMRAAIPTLFEAGGGHYRSLCSLISVRDSETLTLKQQTQTAHIVSQLI